MTLGTQVSQVGFLYAASRARSGEGSQPTDPGVPTPRAAQFSIRALDFSTRDRSFSVTTATNLSRRGIVDLLLFNAIRLDPHNIRILNGGCQLFFPTDSDPLHGQLFSYLFLAGRTLGDAGLQAQFTWAWDKTLNEAVRLRGEYIVSARERVVKAYYRDIDASNIAGALSVFEDQEDPPDKVTIYQRADVVMRGMVSIRTFYEDRDGQGRGIVGSHELTHLHALHETVFVTGVFRGAGADGTPKPPIDFADIWTFGDRLKAVRRQTYLGVGSEIVRR